MSEIEVPETPKPDVRSMTQGDYMRAEALRASLDILGTQIAVYSFSERHPEVKIIIEKK